MKIGIVLPNPPSYSETFFNAKIDALKGSGAEIILFAKKNADYNKTRVIAPLDHNAFGILRFLILILGNFSKLYSFYKLELATRKSKKRAFKNMFLNAHILKEQLDFLHFGYATGAIHRENVALSIKAKMSVSFRGYDINVYPLQDQTCYNLLWQRVYKVHSVSKYLLKQAYKLGLPTTIPVQLIPDAVSEQHVFSAAEITHHLKNNTSNVFKIVTIARLNWIKGVQYAIQAMAEFKSITDKFTYHIIGGGTKQELEYMRFLIQNLGLEYHVVLEGELSHADTLRILKKADMYVQPSIGEGFCTSVVEAQAMGKLCVVTDAGGLPENIVHNQTGLVVPKMNVKLMTQAIADCYHKTDEENLTMAINAAKRVSNHFTTEQQLEQFIKFYS